MQLWFNKQKRMWHDSPELELLNYPEHLMHTKSNDVLRNTVLCISITRRLVGKKITFKNRTFLPFREKENPYTWFENENKDYKLTHVIWRFFPFQPHSHCFRQKSEFITVVREKAGFKKKNPSLGTLPPTLLPYRDYISILRNTENA